MMIMVVYLNKIFFPVDAEISLDSLPPKKKKKQSSFGRFKESYKITLRKSKL